MASARGNALSRCQRVVTNAFVGTTIRWSRLHPHWVFNTVTGEGLAQALAGAQVVVDVANALVGGQRSPGVLRDMSRNLAAAASAADSIVICDS